MKGPSSLRPSFGVFRLMFWDTNDSTLHAVLAWILFSDSETATLAIYLTMPRRRSCCAVRFFRPTNIVTATVAYSCNRNCGHLAFTVDLPAHTSLLPPTQCVTVVDSTELLGGYLLLLLGCSGITNIILNPCNRYSSSQCVWIQ